MSSSHRLPAESALVLVAILPVPRDLDIARTLGWYRIPLRSAPKVVAPDYLAFYQPASFGLHKWRIEWVAEVQGHELVTRAQLLKDELDHPRAAEEYFKLKLGGIRPLPRPIPARRWRRLTFFYTTGAYLASAATVEELVVASEERALLWRALRERAQPEASYTAGALPGVDLPPELLDELLGLVVFTPDGGT